MSGTRFAILLSSLRFDNPEDRAQRRENDPVAPISTILSMLIENSQKCYSIGTNATIDEMLIGFRGRCMFRMYIPNKLEKYGLKLMCLTDSRNSYLYNAGKNSDRIGLSEQDRRHSKPTQAVFRFTELIEG